MTRQREDDGYQPRQLDYDARANDRWDGPESRQEQ